jgi:DNA-binding CsgD family transcriptional regulator
MEEIESGPDVVDSLVSRLYRDGSSVEPDKFRTWALEQVKGVIPCDGALWGSGSAAAQKLHTVVTLGLPPEFPRQLEETMGINPIVPHILRNLERPVDMESVLSDDQFHAHEIYRRVFGPHKIERLLSTGHRDPRSGVHSLLTLYRRDPHQHFTSLEKARQLRLTFHLFNSFSHCFFLHLLRNTDRVAGTGAAVIDAHGMFHESQPRFLDLLDEAFPNRGAAAGLPFPLPPAGQTTTAGRLCVKTQPMGDLFVVFLWPAGPLDRLTSREREIVMAVSQGLSFKQAARKIGVAPSTVANHLYRVYRKLGVQSRTELAAVVHPAPATGG